jgi:hypothetical protein
MRRALSNVILIYMIRKIQKLMPTNSGDSVSSSRNTRRFRTSFMNGTIKIFRRQRDAIQGSEDDTILARNRVARMRRALNNLVFLCGIQKLMPMNY